MNIICENNQLQDFDTNSNEDLLSRPIEWCGKKIVLRIEKDNEEEMSNLLFIANELLENQVEWNNKARLFTAEYILDSANYWRCGEGEPFTIKEIMNKLHLDAITIGKDCTFVFQFDDNVIFKNHSTGKHFIIIEGSLKNGFYEEDSFSY